MVKKGIAILGSTGSIGLSALEVLAQFPERFRVVALAAGGNIERLVSQIRAFHPVLVSVRDEGCARALRETLGRDESRELEIHSGIEGAEAVAAHPEAESVLTAMVGGIGLRPTLVAIRRGIQVAIANKEPLVMAGALCTEEARRSGATLLPVDSEHNAVFQGLRGHRAEDVARVLLTCSGGPFRTLADMNEATLEGALNHPTWSMGPKITVDSSTLMNKALEIIEAHWLFGVPPDRIEVVIHPQSIVHSMVEYIDGSVMAQLGTPDMRTPIGYALAHPGRIPLATPRLDWSAAAKLTFEPVDHERFPALGLAYRALEAGGTCGAVLNAANEVAVEAFLGRRIGYLDIVATIKCVLDEHRPSAADELGGVLAADEWARERARELVTRPL